MAFGTVPSPGGDFDYWIYADDGAALRFGQDQDQAFGPGGAIETIRNTFRHAYGVRALYHATDENFSIGASLLDFELAEPDQHYRLAGADFAWKSGGINLTGEGIYRSSTGGGAADERGAFVQGEFPLGSLPRMWLVGRVEVYRTSLMEQAATIYTAALDYRPSPALVFKLERRDGHGNAVVAPSGWLASIGVLF
jgi:hypothetical protein